MRFPHVRFTVQRMMVSVAVFAILTTMAAPELDRRWKTCRTAAAHHAQLAQFHATDAATYARAGVWTQAAHSRRAEAIHRDLARKYVWSFIDPVHECVLDGDIY
jgi:hypothetical protein